MIGIIILNYKNYKVTLRCIDSIIQHPPYEDYRIIVIDNGSNNESVENIKKEYSANSKISVYCLPENIGFAAGNNYGVCLCEKFGIEKCILTNSDIIFTENSIEKLISSIKKQKDAVIVGPKIKEGILKDAIRHSSMLRKARFIDIIEIGRMFPKKKLDENNGKGLHKVYSVSGCCFAIDVKKFKSMGAFDTNTFLYNEENIMSIQAEKSGFSVYIDLDSVVIHEHGASSGRDNDFVRSEYIKSTLYYWRVYRKISKITLYLILFIYILKLAVMKRKIVHPSNVFQIGKEYLKNLQ